MMRALDVIETIMHVSQGRYRIKSDSYFEELGWRARCHISNIRTFESSRIEPERVQHYVTQDEADIEAIRLGRSLALNRLLSF